MASEQGAMSIIGISGNIKRPSEDHGFVWCRDAAGKLKAQQQ
jgi:hypothetical protein